MALVSKCITKKTMYSQPIELDFEKGFRLWYLADDHGPLIMLTDPNAILERNLEHKCWTVENGRSRSNHIASPFLSDFFGVASNLVRKELQKYPIPKWEDEPVEIELSNVKISYY